MPTTLSTKGPPTGFSDLPMALVPKGKKENTFYVGV